PAHLIELAKREIDLSTATVGILGMAFKAESDDRRDSLSYKLRKLLMLEAKQVLCTDPYVKDASLLPLEIVMSRANVLFIATPHKAYKKLVIPDGKVVIDLWSCVSRTGSSSRAATA